MNTLQIYHGIFSYQGGFTEYRQRESTWVVELKLYNIFKGQPLFSGLHGAPVARRCTVCLRRSSAIFNLCGRAPSDLVAQHTDAS